ncbi:Sas10/Utp3/C1D family protein [Paraphaeosphaeria sporulosa]
MKKATLCTSLSGECDYSKKGAGRNSDVVLFPIEALARRAERRKARPARSKKVHSCAASLAHANASSRHSKRSHTTRDCTRLTETLPHSQPEALAPERAAHIAPPSAKHTDTATMDPETNLPDLTDDFETTIDDLEAALAPVLASPLPTLTSTLPTLDKAKLHILTAYTLESLLFSALQASGADAKAHRIFPELARLKTYFGKVTAAEAAGEGKGVQGPSTKLDKDAAARFIRHGLSGNERYDKERAERLAKERARAALKAKQMAERVNKKFDDDVEDQVQEELGKKRKKAVESDSSDDEDEDMEEPAEPAELQAGGSSEDHVDSENAEFYGEDAAPTDTPSKKAKKEKKDKKSSKRRRSGVNVARKSAKDDRPQELILPERGEEPRTRSETFNALLAGSFAEQKKERKKSKKGKKT